MEINMLIKALLRNRIKTTLLKDKEQLIDFLKEQIPVDSVVGVGDSVTLEETGVYHLLRTGQYRLLDKYRENLSKEEKRKLYLDNFNADFFISSVNAISMDGKLFNMDGNGTRVAPIIYGPRKVFLIAGVNKIVADHDAAIERIRNIAAPLDNVRLQKKNPCIKAGTCVDCKSKTKICNYLSVIQGQFDDERIELILLDGSYGY
ncbi:lactate utilization protein [Bacteroides reticulotermitis]|mgnify:CR=1 FL=1|nr:lactate utilization protein [Bacteroides reticulotermitis]MBB4042286.1 hypothetical protein [Bacteroides reticulotermitis]